MQKAQGYVEQGNLVITVGGVSAAEKAQGSYPQATVNVYNAGTVVAATIYSDNSSTPKANPFTASTTGYFFFYAANGRYDVTFSGGGLAAPLTFGDVLLADPFASGGAVTSFNGRTGAVVPATNDYTLAQISGFPASSSELQFFRRKADQGATAAYEFASEVSYPAADYNFAAITPTGSPNLSIGSNSLTIPIVPNGMNGTNTAYYVYISGGTGTAEAALVTGGTAVSNGLAQTLILTCANTHSGAYTVQSASGGIAEAIIASGSNLSEIVISTAATIYQAIRVSKACVLRGSPGATLTWGGPTATALLPYSVFYVAASNVTLQYLTIVVGTAYYGISNVLSAATSTTINNLRVANNTISGGLDGIHLTSGERFFISQNSISGFTNAGVNVLNAGSPTSIQYINICNNYIDTTSVTVLNGVGIASWGNHSVMNGNLVKLGGNQCQAILFLNNASTGLVDGIISNNVIEVETSNAFEGIGLGSVNGFTVSGNTVQFVGTLSGAGFISIEVNQCSNGTVVGNMIVVNNPSVPVQGIYLESTTGVVVSGNTVQGYGSNVLSNGIALSHIDVLNTASGQCSYNLITGNVVRQTNAAAVNFGIRFETLLAGNCLNNAIRANTVFGNTTAGMVGIKCTNSGGATVTNMQVENNTAISCALGIEITGTNSWIKDNNLISCTTKYLDNGTTSKIWDECNTAPAVVASATSIAASVDNNLFSITGTTTTTTITGGWVGRRIRIYKADAGSVTIGGGGNIPGTHTVAQNAALDLVFNGTNWY